MSQIRQVHDLRLSRPEGTRRAAFSFPRPPRFNREAGTPLKGGIIQEDCLMGDLVQFLPQSNPKSDRAFWLGPGETLAVTVPVDADTAPCEYVAPDEDCG